MSGEKDAIVEFDYDGVIPSLSLFGLSDSPIHYFQVVAIDATGRVVVERFGIAEDSPYLIATIESPSEGYSRNGLIA